MQSFWHGNVETSTDTLVPIVETNTTDDAVVPSTSMNGIASTITNSIDHCNGRTPTSTSVARSCDTTRASQRILPEVHGGIKPKIWSTIGPSASSMDESIVIQPEYQRMDITNGFASANSRFENNVTQTTPNNFGKSFHRRRRNSSNSKQSMDVTSPNGMPHRTFNGR